LSHWWNRTKLVDAIYRGTYTTIGGEPYQTNVSIATRLSNIEDRLAGRKVR
jgi:hypothetical protein